VFALLILTGQLVSFVLQGGISGMAESINEEGIPLSEVIFQALLQVLIAFLGIGWIVRRSLPQALERLGLLIPSRDDVTQGIVTGLKLIVLVFVYAYIMGILINVGVFSESALEQQNEAADSMVKAFSTLPLAVALALSAAVGEEILFRGALQPVFGNLLTSIFFVLMHTQNLIGPGIVMLFIVSYLLGILREQRNTTAAMIGHFVYDFLVIVISMMAASAEAA
jgi:membrane protease YdiL (CAAX protease family)